MKTEKKIQVVMLATDSSNIKLQNEVLYYRVNSLILPSFNKTKLNQPQHLYFLSDDEIKESDYICIQGEYDIDIITKADEAFFDTGLEAKKIIASTNELSDGTGLGIRLLPRPSNSFIQKYVEEYNKGSIITEVMVEYELSDLGKDFIANQFGANILKLKTKPDNTIIISAVEETWDDLFETFRRSPMDN